MELVNGARHVAFKCGMCEWCINSETDLLLHIRYEHKVESNSAALKNFRYMCSHCDRTYKDTEDLLAHMVKTHTRKIKTPVELLTCGICPKSFRTINQLRIHRRSHVRKASPLKCKVCDKVFKMKAKLDAHVCLKRPYVCDTCNLKCDTIEEAENHCLPPFMEKPFLCQVCGKRFRLFQSFWLHKKKREEKNLKHCDDK